MSLFIKNIFLVQLCLILAILYPTSLANLVVEVGTRHSHQTLLHERHGVTDHQQFDCLFLQGFFQSYMKENIKAWHYWNLSPVE